MAISMLKEANSSNDHQLKSEVEYRKKLQQICNDIYAAKNLDEILIDLKNEITSLFAAERITVYVVDGIKRELVSRFKSGEEIGEIRGNGAVYQLGELGECQTEIMYRIIICFFDDSLKSFIRPGLGKLRYPSRNNIHFTHKVISWN